MDYISSRCPDLGHIENARTSEASRFQQTEHGTFGAQPSLGYEFDRQVFKLFFAVFGYAAVGGDLLRLAYWQRQQLRHFDQQPLAVAGFAYTSTR